MVLRPLTLIGTTFAMVTGVALGVLAYHHLREDGGDHHGSLDEVLRHISAMYVEDVPERKLMRDAIGGMLSGLDAHTSLLNRRAYERLQDDTNGRFTGIGVELGLVEGYFTIIAPIDGSPAVAAGLRSGDRIIEVDHESLKGARLNQVARRMRGPVGTRVHVRIKRKDQPAFDVEVERAIVESESVTTRWLQPGIAYVRIAQFRSRTGDKFERAVRALAVEQPLQGMVLDLRNNPGGLLQTSVAVADALLTDGLIVYTEGRLPSSITRYRASGSDLLDGAPLVVLINAGSASASEVVAGALSDHDRATLIGERTYGKGSVQSVIPLSDGRALKLTSAYYYTPLGTSIHEQGIEPDIVMSDVDDDTILAAALDALEQMAADANGSEGNPLAQADGNQRS